MRSKCWEFQLGDTLHNVEFSHGRFLKKHRQLLVDGEPAVAKKWRIFYGKTPVTEYFFTWQGHTLTVVIQHVKRAKTFDLFLDGISLEHGTIAPDLAALSSPKSKAEKLRELLLILVVYLLWRILVGLFGGGSINLAGGAWSLMLHR